VGVEPREAAGAVESFRSVKRRLEVVAEVHGVTIIDDFAHHPTAVQQTLEALRGDADGRLICVFEPRSNTMRRGIQRDALSRALKLADAAYVYRSPQLCWDARELQDETIVVVDDTDEIIERLYRGRRCGDRIVVMSNGGFDSLVPRLADRMRSGAA